MSDELNSGGTAPSITLKEPSCVSELIAQSRRNPLRWLVPDVVQEDGNHILHGAEESFKTMLTLQLHECLEVGGLFLTRNGILSNAVILVDVI